MFQRLKTHCIVFSSVCVAKNATLETLQLATVAKLQTSYPLFPNFDSNVAELASVLANTVARFKFSFDVFV